MRQGFKPPVPVAIQIGGPAGQIEARLEDPAKGLEPQAVGVICHPHPLYGGTMQNKVVHTLARAMQELGVPTLRFNFRGVGGSDGDYDGGVGEVEDALAVVAWARARWNSDARWLAGFSFGAAMALRASAPARPRQLVTVAPPVQRLDLAPVPRPEGRWLVVQGDEDELVSFEAVRAWVDGYDPAPRRQVLEGAEHFFHGRLRELREAVVAFLKDGA